MEYGLIYVTQEHTAKCPFQVSSWSSGSEHKTKKILKEENLTLQFFNYDVRNLMLNE
jgi:hypothetical protein